MLSFYFSRTMKFYLPGWHLFAPFYFSIHTANRDNTRFPCPNCYRSFGSKSGLSLHLRRCAPCPALTPVATSEFGSEDDFPCSGCGKKFSTRSSLAQHQRRYCRPDADPENSCAEFKHVFSTFDGLQQHRRKAHLAAYQALLEATDRRKSLFLGSRPSGWLRPR